MAAASRRVAVLDRPAAYLEAGAGRPVVLLHGAAGRGAVWRRQLDGLADVARLIAPDLPGHGDTAGPGCRRIDAYAAWVLALLDALGLGPVVLVGHSMGGAIALTVALQSPGRLAGLGLVATGARLRVLPRILELFGEGSSRGWNLISSLSYSPRTPAGTVTDAEQALRETAITVSFGDYQACDAFDVLARLGEVRVPTLVVAGADDRLTPPRYAEALAGRIPGARLVAVDAAGHFPMLEQPQAVDAALRAFLAALP